MKVRDVSSVAWVIVEFEAKGYFSGIDEKNIDSMILTIAEKFREKYPDIDQSSKDYKSNVKSFTIACVAQILWDSFSGVPVDLLTGKIKRAWSIFEEGTSESDIRLWFKQNFGFSCFVESKNQKRSGS